MAEIPNQWIDIIQNVGFPIFLSIYVLFRLEKKMDELIKELRTGLARIQSVG